MVAFKLAIAKFAPVNFLALIEAKRDGQALRVGELREIIAAVVAGEIPDYQMAAFLMAVFFRSLNNEETTALTLAMRDSGDVLTRAASRKQIPIICHLTIRLIDGT